jgi:hypothetical protein
MRGVPFEDCQMNAAIFSQGFSELSPLQSLAIYREMLGEPSMRVRAATRRIEEDDGVA